MLLIEGVGCSANKVRIKHQQMKSKKADVDGVVLLTVKLRTWQIVAMLLIFFVFFLLCLTRVMFGNQRVDRPWISFVIRFALINLAILIVRACSDHYACRIEEIAVISGVAITFYYAMIAPYVFPNSLASDY